MQNSLLNKTHFLKNSGYRKANRVGKILKSEVMICQKCGSQNPDHVKFCNSCGNLLFADNSETKLHPGFIVLAILIPLVGYIQYFTWKKEAPQKAQNIIVWAIVGTVLNLIILMS